MESFRDWLARLSGDAILAGVLKGDREVFDLVDLVWAWIRSSYDYSPEVIESEVRTVIEETVQALQEDGKILYQPDVDALIERSLYWTPSNPTLEGAYDCIP